MLSNLVEVEKLGKEPVVRLREASRTGSGCQAEEQEPGGAKESCRLHRTGRPHDTKVPEVSPSACSCAKHAA